MEEIDPNDVHDVRKVYTLIFLSDIGGQKGASLPYLNAIEGAVVKYI